MKLLDIFVEDNYINFAFDAKPADILLDPVIQDIKKFDGHWNRFKQVWQMKYNFKSRKNAAEIVRKYYRSQFDDFFWVNPDGIIGVKSKYNHEFLFTENELERSALKILPGGMKVYELPESSISKDEKDYLDRWAVYAGDFSTGSLRFLEPLGDYQKYYFWKKRKVYLTGKQIETSKSDENIIKGESFMKKINVVNGEKFVTNFGLQAVVSVDPNNLKRLKLDLMDMDSNPIGSTFYIDESLKIDYQQYGDVGNYYREFLTAEETVGANKLIKDIGSQVFLLNNRSLKEGFTFEIESNIDDSVEEIAQTVDIGDGETVENAKKVDYQVLSVGEKFSDVKFMEISGQEIFENVEKDGITLYGTDTADGWLVSFYRNPNNNDLILRLHDSNGKYFKYDLITYGRRPGYFHDSTKYIEYKENGGILPNDDDKIKIQELLEGFKDYVSEINKPLSAAAKEESKESVEEKKVEAAVNNGVSELKVEKDKVNILPAESGAADFSVVSTTNNILEQTEKQSERYRNSVREYDFLVYSDFKEHLDKNRIEEILKENEKYLSDNNYGLPGTFEEKVLTWKDSVEKNDWDTLFRLYDMLEQVNYHSEVKKLMNFNYDFEKETANELFEENGDIEKNALPLAWNDLEDWQIEALVNENKDSSDIQEAWNNSIEAEEYWDDEKENYGVPTLDFVKKYLKREARINSWDFNEEKFQKCFANYKKGFNENEEENVGLQQELNFVDEISQIEEKPINQDVSIVPFDGEEKNKFNPTDEEIFRRFIPESEYGSIQKGLSGEEKMYFKKALSDFARNVRSVMVHEDAEYDESKPSLVGIHYFIGNSDWFVSEIRYNDDGFTDEMFGYVVLNGDTQNSELGYLSYEEFKDIFHQYPLFQADLHVPENADLKKFVHGKYEELFADNRVDSSNGVNYTEINLNKQEIINDRGTGSGGFSGGFVLPGKSGSSMDGALQGEESVFGPGTGSRSSGVSLDTAADKDLSGYSGLQEGERGMVSDSPVEKSVSIPLGDRGRPEADNELSGSSEEKGGEYDSPAGVLDTQYAGDGSGVRVREASQREDSGSKLSITPSEVRKIREQCRNILKKNDSLITEDEKKVLALYEGDGGLHDKIESDEGHLSAFYTPSLLVEKVSALALHYCPSPESMLEPTCGTGRFADYIKTGNTVMYEIDGTAARIAQILHPECKVINDAFQRQFFDEGKRFKLKNYELPKFDLVVGNPPYTEYKTEYHGLGEGHEFRRYEQYFISRGLDSLKDDKSVLAMVVPSTFLSNNIDKARAIIAEKGYLVDAYRLPENIFPTTSVGTDIIIMKKGKCPVSELGNNDWFKKHPEKILGVTDKRVNRFGKEEIFVHSHDGLTPFDELEKIVVGKTNEVISENDKEINSAKDYVEEKTGRIVLNSNELYVLQVNQDRKFERGKKTVLPSFIINKLISLSDQVHEKYISKNYSSWKDLVAKDNSEKYDLVFKLRTPTKGYLSVRNEKNQVKFFEINFSEEIIRKPVNGNTFSEQENNSQKESKEVPQQGKKEVPSTGIGDSVKKKELFASDRILSSEEFFDHYYKGNFDKRDFYIPRFMTYDGFIDVSRISSSDIKQYVMNNDKFVEAEPGMYQYKELYASGDIYFKMDRLEEIKDSLKESSYIRNKSILENVLPEKKKLADIMIMPLSSFAGSFNEDSKQDDFTVSVDVYVGSKRADEFEEMNVSHYVEQMNLRDAFIAWATGYLSEANAYEKDSNLVNKKDIINDFTKSNFSRNELPATITWSDIYDFLTRKPVIVKNNSGKNNSEIIDEKAVKEEAKERCRRVKNDRMQICNLLFKKFLMTGLSEEDSIRLENYWNKRNNCYRKTDWMKIPFFVDGMRTFKNGKPFILHKQQLIGGTCLSYNGNGCLAYDVGVGKTAAGIIATVNIMQTGRAKKPLVIVPNSVYSQWCNDFKELFPNIKINELDNFRSKNIGDYYNGNHGLNIQNGSISVCCESGLDMITFTEESCNNILFDSFKELLSVRSDAKGNSTVKEALGIVNAVKKDDYIFFENTGFDYICADEAHNYKNLFTRPRAFEKEKRKRLANEFEGIGSGKPSMEAKKMFAMCQLVQVNNHGRNVCLLTATPFTNNPIEVYSMLCLMGRKELLKRGIFNLYNFCSQFADCRLEWSVDSNQEVKMKMVMKQFRDIASLQHLLGMYFDKVDGEQAGIIRPDKIEKKIEITPTPLQELIFNIERERMEGDNVLTSIANMRTACLSPALLDENLYEDIKIPPLSEAVNCSPKLMFVCDSLISLWKEMPERGQVVIMAQGVKAFPAMKKYLVDGGVPEGVIEIISGNGEFYKTPDEKDMITQKFNDINHPCKIIIGTDVIKEGINLNGNSFVLYDPFLWWNPTDRIQAQGRIWRQGNKQKNVFIITPFLIDSVDSVLLQKLDEKSSRINDIWSYNGSSDAIDLSSVNPADLKFDLIRDPEKKARLLYDDATAALLEEKKNLENMEDDLYQFKINAEGKHQKVLYYENLYDNIGKDIEVLRNEKKDLMTQLKNKSNFINSDEIERKVLELDFEIKEKIRLRSDYRIFRDSFKGQLNTVMNTLSYRFGLTDINDKEKYQAVIDAYYQRKLAIDKEIEEKKQKVAKDIVRFKKEFEMRKVNDKTPKQLSGEIVREVISECKYIDKETQRIGNAARVNLKSLFDKSKAVTVEVVNKEIDEGEKLLKQLNKANISCSSRKNLSTDVQM